MVDCFVSETSGAVRTEVLTIADGFAGICEAAIVVRVKYPKALTLWYVGENGVDVGRSISIPCYDKESGAKAMVETIYPN